MTTILAVHGAHTYVLYAWPFPYRLLSCRPWQPLCFSWRCFRRPLCGWWRSWMNRTMSRQPLMPHSAQSWSYPIIACSTYIIHDYIFIRRCSACTVSFFRWNCNCTYILHTVHYTVTIRIAMQVLKYYKSTHYSQLCCAIILYIYTCTCTVHSVICIKYTRTYACTSECTYIYTHAHVNLTWSIKFTS